MAGQITFSRKTLANIVIKPNGQSSLIAFLRACRQSIIWVSSYQILRNACTSHNSHIMPQRLRQDSSNRNIRDRLVKAVEETEMARSRMGLVVPEVLLLVEQVRSRRSQIDDLWTPITILLEPRTFETVEGIRNSLCELILAINYAQKVQ